MKPTFNVWVLQEELEAKAAICRQTCNYCSCKVKKHFVVFAQILLRLRGGQKQIS